MREVPVADTAPARRGFEPEGHRTLLEVARAQRERAVQRVAEAGIDVPRPVGMIRRRQAVDEQHEVVVQVGGVGLARGAHRRRAA